MGENDSAMEYDENLIFTHLYAHVPFDNTLISSSARCFYLDTPDNARKNDMAAKSKHEATIIKQYDLLFSGGTCLS